MKMRYFYVFLLIILIALFIWSFNHPAKFGIWFFEVAPGVVLISILLKTFRRFPLSPLAYFVVFFAVVMVFIGGHYTYGGVPLFNKISEVLHLSRNHFDRLGHFFQGMTTTVLIRECFIRLHLIRLKIWLQVISISICIAFSAGYEIFEFLIGFFFVADLQDFLGYQGDIWDSHWDMVSALLGGVVILLLSKWHDKQIKRIRWKKSGQK